MAQTNEENANEESVKEEDLDEKEEDTDEEDEDESDSKKEDESEDEESDEDDSDEDDDKPLTRKDLDSVVDRILAKRSKNRSMAADRNSKKRPLSDKARSGKDDERLDQIEANQRRIDLLEEKRNFGFVNDLPPDEVDVVYKLNKKPTAKTLKDPIVRGALEGYRTDKRVRNNIPSTNARHRTFGGKAYKDLPESQRQEHFSTRRAEILARKKGG